MRTFFAILTAISHLITKRSEIIVAFVVIGVVFMMILPLPTLLVDILIAINISVSALLVIMALYMPGPLAFSTFPALLLITTLFRLALSVTTTRLILLQADAGHIVEAFGNFVVGGNLVVGVVIFLILMLVNFMVITKGSERIAEVSARFTLDAMPGKQMSIDSDLRAGLLDAQQAQAKRHAVTKESQLFGAMDGAMKFVKGDAIAGIIIVFVNILGGFSIGVMQMSMSAEEAIKLYTILTIGDGLVAQIPSLLISLTAGLIITRVKDDSTTDTNVGQEMAKQLSSEPKAWIIAAVVLFGFALIPGMPTAAFLVLAAVFVSVGAGKIYITKMTLVYSQQAQASQARVQQAVRDDVEVNTFSVYERASISFHPSLSQSRLANELERQLRVSRNDIVLNLGYILPSFKVVIDNSLATDEFVLRFYEVPVINGTLSDDLVAVKINHCDLLEKANIAYTPGSDARSEQDYVWVAITEIEKLKANEIAHYISTDLINQRTKQAILKECHQFIGLEESHKIMRWATSEIPELAKEFSRLMPISSLAEILRNLASESISLRSLRKIFETLVAHAAGERDINALTEIVRISLREQICNQLAKNKNIDVCLLEPETEEILRDSLRRTATGGFLNLNQDDAERLVNEIKSSTEMHRNDNKSIALVVAQDIRRYLRDMIKTDIFDLPVLSFAELSPSIKVTPVSRLSIL
jgi:type III secretion protein V